MGHEDFRRVSAGSSVTTHRCTPPAARTSRVVAASPSRDGRSEGTDRGAEAVRGDQTGDRAVPQPSPALDEIGQYGAGFDRGQLVRVADQQQARLGGGPLRGGGPSSTATPWTSRRRRSRHAANRLSRLCRNRDEVSDGCRAAGATWWRSGVAGGCGRRRRVCRPRTARLRANRAAALPVGASAIRSRVLPPMSACSASRASRRATVVVFGAGPPVSTVNARDSATRRPPAARRSCRGTGGRRPASGSERWPAARARDVPGDPALLDPIAVEVDQTVLHVQHRRVTSQDAGRDRSRSTPGRGPRQLSARDLLLQGREVDASPIRRARPARRVPPPGRPASRSPGQRRQPLGDQDVGRPMTPPR